MKRGISRAALQRPPRSLLAIELELVDLNGPDGTPRPMAIFYPPDNLSAEESNRLSSALLGRKALPLADFSTRKLVDELLERGGRALRELAQLLDPRF